MILYLKAYLYDYLCHSKYKNATLIKSNDLVDLFFPQNNICINAYKILSSNLFFLCINAYKVLSFNSFLLCFNAYESHEF
jgi:hypothetical protein